MTGLSLLFFFLDLSMIYRSKEIQNEIIKLEVQKIEELNYQRNVISNDLHDDAGASLSSLYVYSTIAENAVESDTSLAREHLKKISRGIREVMENTNDIIWAVNRDEKNVKLFSSRIKDHYYELFDASNIHCSYQIDDNLEIQLKSIPTRRNFLLITKEAINNAIKHSGASEISIILKKIGENVELCISDNGTGMTEQIGSKGNGLNNMKFRAESLDGKLIITSRPGYGTKISCLIPITRISD